MGSRLEGQTAPDDVPIALDGSNIHLPELVELVASCMDRNDVALGLSCACKATAAALRGKEEYKTVRLSKPVPSHAFAARFGTPKALRDLTLSQRKQLLCLTAASGSMPNLEVAWAAVSAGFVSDSDLLGRVLSAAAKAGHVHVCLWVLDHHGFSLDTPDASILTAEAAAAGQREACELLLDRGVSWSVQLVAEAYHGGHPDLAEQLLLRRPEGPLGPEESLACLAVDNGECLLFGAAEGCDLRTLQSLHARLGAAGNSTFGTTMFYAAGSPTPDWHDKVEWLESIKPAGFRKADVDCVRAAGCADALDRLTWLRARGYSMVFSDWIAQSVVEAGDTEVLEFLLACGTRLGQDSAVAAATAGRLSALQLLHARGFLTGNLLPLVTAAARYGRTAVVEWLLEVKPVLLADVRGSLVKAAAESGSVEMLAWLRERGCPWTEGAVAAAAGAGCEAALEWMVEDGCPAPADGKPYAKATDQGDLAMMRCLARLGFPWGPPHMCPSVRSLHDPWGPRHGSLTAGGVNITGLADPKLPVLGCMVELGCPITWEQVQAAARCWPQEVQVWVKEELRPRWVVRQRLERARERREQQERNRDRRAERLWDRRERVHGIRQAAAATFVRPV